MPTYKMPKSDMARLSCLGQAMETGRGDLEEGRTFITAGLLAEITEFYPLYQDAYGTVSAKLGERVRVVARARAATAQVELYLRHLWDSITNRARRQGLVGVLPYYRLPTSGKRPNPDRRALWLRLADEVIAGDAAAVAAGYAPVQEPSAAELEAVLTVAYHATAQIPQADLAYDEAQAALAALRPRADALIVELVHHITFATRHQDAPSQRRTLRRYGAKFRADEADDGGDGQE